MSAGGSSKCLDVYKLAAHVIVTVTAHVTHVMELKWVCVQRTDIENICRSMCKNCVMNLFDIQN